MAMEMTHSYTTKRQHPFAKTRGNSLAADEAGSQLDLRRHRVEVWISQSTLQPLSVALAAFLMM